MTAAIFAFLFGRYPVDRVVATLAEARWGLFLLLMVPYGGFYLLVDTFVLQQAVSWFNVRVAYRDVLPVRATAYILSLVNTQLGQGGIAVYLHRRHRIPFWQVTGTVVFVALIEIYQLALYSSIGAAISREPKAPWAVYGVMAGYLVGHLLYFSLPSVRRASGLPILAAFRRARPVQYLLLLLAKTPNLLAAVLVHWLALPLFGIEIPLTTLLTFLPLVFFFAALPIAAAHLGPSQAAWTYFFADYATGEQLLAYSLASHFTFMVVNALYGLLFLRRAARELAGP
ncbi:MAG TPA: hypothetical protein VNO26_01070 [Candidatus Limnocylindria bacterium]|nr:hypothetical protein [Candidatus Limnocylindria bacterium]